MFAKKVTCSHCGVWNSVSRKPQTFPRCGRCSRPLVVVPRTATPTRSTASPWRCPPPLDVATPTRPKAARPSPWLFFWPVTLGLIAGVAWHESDQAAVPSGVPTVTRNAHANGTIIGRASVIDGDTIEIHGERIRLWGVDAPEGQQRCTRDGKPWRCGTEAANALDEFIASRPVTCTERDRDRYRRIVAICKVGGEDLGAWLVRHGWALDYARYSRGTYARQQSQARSERCGIWQGAFEAPWEWRRR